MKALFNRLKNGGRKVDNKDRESIDTRSLRDKPQPAVPITEYTTESLLGTPPRHSDRELPPITVDNEHLDMFTSSMKAPVVPLSTHSDTTPPSIPGSSHPTTGSISDSQLSRPPRHDAEPSGQTDVALLSKKVAFASSSSLPSDSAPGQQFAQRSQSQSGSSGSLPERPNATSPPVARGLTSPKSSVSNQRVVSSPVVPRNTSETVRTTSGRPSAPTLPQTPSSPLAPIRTASSDTQRKASSSRTAVNQSPPSLPRKPQHPGLQDVMSVRSSTPMSYISSRTSVQAAASWSEAAEEDLVSNLGSRERIRQEVLWEIVTSEDR